MQAMTVVIHDVAPATLPACQGLLSMIADLAALPVTLLVVPRYRGEPADPAFEKWLSRAAQRGHELALHGYTHCDDAAPQGWLDHLKRRCYTAGEGEFAALEEREATRRLLAGKRWFAAHGWPLRGFVPPAWLISEGALRAVDEQGFAYTATLSRLVRLPSRSVLRSQSLVFSTRSAWRRASSLAWNNAVALRERNNYLLRLELHPADGLFPAIRECWLRLLVAGLRTRRPLTVYEAIRQAPAGLWTPGMT